MNHTINTYFPISDAASFFSARKGKVRFEERRNSTGKEAVDVQKKTEAPKNPDERTL